MNYVNISSQQYYGKTLFTSEIYLFYKNVAILRFGSHLRFHFGIKRFPTSLVTLNRLNWLIAKHLEVKT